MSSGPKSEHVNVTLRVLGWDWSQMLTFASVKDSVVSEVFDIKLNSSC